MRGRDEAVAQIEVRMLRFPRPGGDEVHVHVEDARVGEWPQTAESRFFLDLPQGDRPRIPLSLAVPARLQPSIQAAVMEEEDVLADPTHFPPQATLPDPVDRREKIPVSGVADRSRPVDNL